MCTCVQCTGCDSNLTSPRSSPLLYWLQTFVRGCPAAAAVSCLRYCSTLRSANGLTMYTVHQIQSGRGILMRRFLFLVDCLRLSRSPDKLQSCSALVWCDGRPPCLDWTLPKRGGHIGPCGLLPGIHDYLCLFSPLNTLFYVAICLSSLAVIL